MGCLKNNPQSKELLQQNTVNRKFCLKFATNTDLKVSIDMVPCFQGLWFSSQGFIWDSEIVYHAWTSRLPAMEPEALHSKSYGI